MNKIFEPEHTLIILKNEKSLQINERLFNIMMQLETASCMSTGVGKNIGKRSSCIVEQMNTDPGRLNGGFSKG